MFCQDNGASATSHPCTIAGSSGHAFERCHSGSFSVACPKNLRSEKVESLFQYGFWESMLISLHILCSDINCYIQLFTIRWYSKHALPFQVWIKRHQWHALQQKMDFPCKSASENRLTTPFSRELGVCNLCPHIWNPDIQGTPTKGSSRQFSQTINVAVWWTVLEVSILLEKYISLKKMTNFHITAS